MKPWASQSTQISRMSPATCLVWSETIFVMAMRHERFASFTSKPIADTENNIAGILAYNS